MIDVFVAGLDGSQGDPGGLGFIGSPGPSGHKGDPGHQGEPGEAGTGTWSMELFQSTTVSSTVQLDLRPISLLTH